MLTGFDAQAQQKACKHGEIEINEESPVMSPKLLDCHYAEKCQGDDADYVNNDVVREHLFHFEECRPGGVVAVAIRLRAKPDSHDTKHIKS